MSTSCRESGDLGSLLGQVAAYLRGGDGPSALALCCRILQTDIDLAAGYHMAGLALELIGDDAGALASHLHAVEIAPAFAAPLGDLALMSLQHQDRKAAAGYAARALALDPADPAGSLALARIAAQDGRAAEAVERLAYAFGPQRLATPQHDALAHRIHGDALDILGRKDEAFAAYAASAALLRRQYAAACAGPGSLTGLDLSLRLRDAYLSADTALWRPAPGEAPGEAAGHVFIVGFPRSGTTLLEQVLASHPQVVALEEQPTLAPTIDAFLDPPGRLSDLVHMDEATAERWRRDYWERVRGFGVEPAGKVFVDKQPFYSLWLPLIGKLFPSARIIVARRDPRDVVLSCFRRPFRMTPVTYELMDLARSAQLYCAAMDIVSTVLDRSSLRSLVYRHEDMVDDFGGVARRLCAFLDLPWTEQLRDFAATAKTRSIRTPSALQVIRGLNRDGVAAWRAYAPHLGSVLPILEPYVQAFGYPASQRAEILNPIKRIANDLTEFQPPRARVRACADARRGFA